MPSPARHTYTSTSTSLSNQSLYESNQEEQFEDTNLNLDTQQDDTLSNSEAEEEDDLYKPLNTQPTDYHSENHQSWENSQTLQTLIPYFDQTDINMPPLSPRP